MKKKLMFLLFAGFLFLNAKLPQTIPNSYVIPSNGCTAARDRLHFSAEGYRKSGKRYAARMLPILSYNVTIPE